MKYFNSVTGQIEDDGQGIEIPSGFSIPSGRVASPDGSQDVQVPASLASQNEYASKLSKDLNLDMAGNPDAYPFARMSDLGSLSNPQEPQAPQEMNPAVKEYLMKKMGTKPGRQPNEPTAEGDEVDGGAMPIDQHPAIAAQKAPSVMDQFSPEKYKEVLSQMKNKQSDSAFAQMAAGFGDALARKDSSGTDKFFGDLRNQIQDQTTGEFGRQKAMAVSDIKTKQELNKLDPNSQESQNFRKLVQSTMPNIAKTYGENFDLVTAADKESILDFGKMRELIDARKQTAQMAYAMKKEAHDAKASELSSTRAKQMGLYKNGAAAEDQYTKATQDKNDYDPTSSGQWIDNSNWAPNMLKNNKAIEAKAAEDAWIESYLRDASGAAIADKERSSYSNIYFPQAGDTKSVVANKKALREEKARSAGVAAGLSHEAPIPSRRPSQPTGKKPGWAQ